MQLYIADSSVTSAKIADGAVSTADLADAAVTLAKLAVNSVDSSKIVDGTIGYVDVNTNEIQRRVGSCPAGQVISVVNADGSVSCVTGGIGGSGAVDSVAKFTGINTIGNSAITETGGNVGIGTTGPTQALDINGQVKIRGGSPGAGKVLTSSADGTATWSLSVGIAVMTGTGGIGADLVISCPAAKTAVAGHCQHPGAWFTPSVGATSITCPRHDQDTETGNTGVVFCN